MPPRTDYVEGTTLWIRRGPHRNQVATYCESKSCKMCLVELLNGTRVYVTYGGIEAIHEGPPTEADVRGPGYSMDDIVRLGGWRFQNNAIHYSLPDPIYLSNMAQGLVKSVGLLTRELEETNKECRWLRSMVESNQNRIQDVENVLHNDEDVPTGF
ncbi:hypothetical protein SEMRO_949_G223670.1 [Seminavis robusta]|uniref:Uncharacterized protein n=1 Tax=Seminavis robusta TaxID=568900 RepID=A0A9N8EE99_9STRA|nr:hypothetical protein SEMRO_949_G223670.1 [Seminavis robusta]|eukprot:Sro949_g223670.1 n/a (156) ;mRNA; r:21164-21631